MGAGNFPAGTGPAGLDPVISSRPRDPIPIISSLAVDGLTKDYQLDAAGRYVGVNWVDNAAFTLLRIAEGSVKSAPAVGETVSKIRYIDQVKIQAQVEDRVKVAWRDLLSRNLVEIVDIILDLTVAGRIMYVVNYRNLLTGARKQASPNNSAGAT